MDKDTVVVKIERLDHGVYNVLDQNGNDLSGEIPDSAVRRAARETGYLYQLVTSNGNVQWRNADPSECEHLFSPRGMADVMTHEQIINFINTSPNLIPDDFMIDEVKWKYLIRSVLRGNNILMTGPSGCGKTKIADVLHQVFPERPFFRFNLGATQDARSTLIGNTHFNQEDGTFVTPSLFVRAIQTPNSIILLDELSRAHHDAVNILMTVLDATQKYLRIDEDPDTPTIGVAPGVTFVSTANIGAEYTATRVLDRAILDRFQIIEMEPLKLEDELSLLKIVFPKVKEDTLYAIAEIADHTRSQVKSDNPKVSTIISTRQTIELASLINDGFSLEDAAEVCIYPFYPADGGMDSERTYVSQMIQKHIETTNDPDPWYSDPADPKNWSPQNV